MESHRLSIPPLSPLLISCYVVARKRHSNGFSYLSLFYLKLKAQLHSDIALHNRTSHLTMSVSSLFYFVASMKRLASIRW